MKFLTHSLLAAAVLMTLAGNANAQILWNPLSIHAITNASDISLSGSAVDALGADNFGSAVTVGTTTFNPFFGSDPKITFSGAIGGGSDGSHSTATAYQTVLDGVAYTNFGDTPAATVSLNGLHNGYTYQVQVWNDGGRPTNIVGADTVTITGQYVLGLFEAGVSPETFTFNTTLPGNAGEISAIDLRLISVPEPSTYALMLGGLAFLAFCVRRKRTLVK